MIRILPRLLFALGLSLGSGCAWSNPGPSPAAPAPAQPSGTAARPEAPPRDPVVNAPELPDAQNDSLKRAILADSLRADSLRADSLRKAQRRR